MFNVRTCTVIASKPCPCNKTETRSGNRLKATTTKNNFLEVLFVASVFVIDSLKSFTSTKLFVAKPNCCKKNSQHPQYQKHHIKMADNWDDSDDDDWDVDDDALDAKLGLNKKDDAPVNNFDDEEDLAIKEKEDQDRLNNIALKKKGSALAAKKQTEKDRADDLDIARKALELEAELEANLSIDERKIMQRKREEEAELDMMGDAFGGGVTDGGAGNKGAQQAGDKVVMKDMKDHMKHARKVADAMKVS